MPEARKVRLFNWHCFIAVSVCLFVFPFTAVPRPYGLSVTSVTATSAILHWKNAAVGTKALDFQASNSAHTVVALLLNLRTFHLQVHCAGVRHYKANGAPMTDVDRITQFVPTGMDQIFLGNLQANFNYSCVILEQDTIGELSDPSKACFFSTHYGGKRSRSIII